MEMKKLVPDIMRLKIEEANVQQAFVKSAVEHFSDGKKNLNILCIGSFEDTAFETLKYKGYSITAIDPILNTDLNGFIKKKDTAKSSYDIIFSTSVIEHVQDDELFISQITSLLAVDGVAILTADFDDNFVEGNVKPHTDCRLYTNKDILLRLVPLMHSCELVGPHFWQSCVPDFSFEGATYSFISLVFRKKKELPDDEAFSNDIRTAMLENKSEKVNNVNQLRENIDIRENVRNEIIHSKPGFFRRLERSIRKRRKRMFG
jgi:SAM-dependent methyltransferase